MEIELGIPLSPLEALKISNPTELHPILHPKCKVGCVLFKVSDYSPELACMSRNFLRLTFIPYASNHFLFKKPVKKNNKKSNSLYLHHNNKL